MRRLIITSLVLLLPGIMAFAQEVKDVSIIGVFTEGKTVTANYTLEGASGTADVFLQWMRVSATDSTDLATTTDYTLVTDDVGFKLLLRVVLEDGAVQDTAWSALSPDVIANTEPVASSVALAGGLDPGDYIFGDYDYSDVDGDAEGASVYRWVISSAGDFSDTAVIAGETTKSYQIQTADEGRYFFFGVRPVAQTGTQTTDYTWSAVHGPVNTNAVPLASNVTITGNPDPGSILSGSYDYSDADGDPEGTSTYQWRISDTDVFGDATDISGATSRNYQVVASDEDKYFFFGVEPAAQSGATPGTYAWSMAHGPATDGEPPVASNVTISGGLRTGDLLTGDYDYSDPENDPEGVSVYEWVMSDDLTVGDGDDVTRATSKTYTLQTADEGNYIFFGVEPVAQTGESPGTKVWSAVHGPVIINTPPTTSNRTISGTPWVDEILNGDYDYADTDNDLEGNSNYRWAAGTSTSQGDASIISGEANSFYKIQDADQGKYIFFGVQPVAQTGDTDGTEEWSAAFGPVNSQPAVSAVIIDNTAPEVDDVLTGSYTYNDIDGDPEGTSTYRWLRDGTEEIAGATSLNYTVTYDDVGSSLVFEVTPVSASAYPAEGDPVQSTATADVPPSGVPVASDICISGVRNTGNTVQGKYTYTYNRQEGNSLYQWYRDGTAIPGATSESYVLTKDDIESVIQFAVTPVSKFPSIVTGAEVFSDTLATFVIPTDNVSVADPPFTLEANPEGGVFTGEGVSVNTFDPAAVNTDNSPFIIDYLLTIQYDGYSCIQEVSDTVNVKPVETYFESFKDVYCYDNGNDTIILRNLPSDASKPAFIFTEPSAVVSQLNDTIVIFNPALMGPGDNADSLYFTYQRDSSLIEINKGFVIDSVGTALSFQNLDDAYCTDAPARFISVNNLYPAGGSGEWTGDMLTSKSDGSAVFDPALVPAGVVYPVTYRYTSPRGCKSLVISRDVTINPLPDADFNIDPTYNIEGDPDLLVPALAGGTFTGSGIVGDQFYPGLAGVGSHDIRYSVTDVNGCFAAKTNNTLVREAQGSIEGLPDIICYDDIIYSISVSGLPAGVSITGFSNTKGGISSSGPTTADYYIPGVGAGRDTVSFAYIWEGVDYELSRTVYIDSIGKLEIIGLNDSYCEYEGDVNMRVSVENSTGSGNFDFSGPDTSFVNYGQIADLYPYKTPPSATPYQLSFTHVSTVQSSGCTKTVTRDVYVHSRPDVEILTDRSTVSLDETPFELTGSPADGTFAGNGVYLDGTVYKFNPSVAGEGSTVVNFSYADTNSCASGINTSITVVQPEGAISGINEGKQYCYDGLSDTLIYENTGATWTGIGFEGAGITAIDDTRAVFDPAAAGRGDHRVQYSYYDSVLTRFVVSVTLKVDSLGTVEINNLDAGDEFCNNTEPFELFTSKLGGVFTGPVDDNFLDPSMGLGDTEVSYTYTNQETGCYVAVSVPVKINPAPVVDFDVRDVCIEHGEDTTIFINNTVSDDPVDTWAWRFGDPGSFNESDLESPGHLYRTHGLRLVELTATTVNACTGSREKNIDLGIKPEADFAWTGDCYIIDDSLLLFDKSFSPAPVTDHIWSFFDGSDPLSGEQVRYPKTSVGEFDVQLVVKTAYTACHDTIIKEVTIRPTITLEDDDYYQDFEDGQGGWIAGLGESLNEWSFGTPGRAVMDEAASGSNAWYTNFDIGSQEESGYSVESPCFDFTNISRPYVSIDVWKRFDRNRDGAALQYRVGSSGDWRLVGSLDDGINWYNSVLISGKPGGQSIGWTSVGGQDTGWVNVRNKLDVIAGKKDVKFRLVYGSDGTANENEGFAFDNFSIGTRSRNVLLEHFTNYNNTDNKDANELLKEVVDNTGSDVINVQYHTNIPGGDDFYYDNEADVSARMLFYGLSATPYSFVDGGINTFYAFEYNYVLNNRLDSVDLYKRSMINPYFDMDISSQVAEGILTVSCDITALEDVDAQNLTLYVLVIEKETDYNAPNGETVFYNVFKKMLPDAGGTDIKKSWLKGESESFDGFSWLIENIYDTGDIEIIAFLQNNASKEVYQSASTYQPDVPTAVYDPVNKDLSNSFSVYPNPASDYLHIDFREELEDAAVLSIYNYAGNKVLSRKLPVGLSELRIDDLHLPEGIFIIRLLRDGRSIAYKKLVISRR